jgi:hypothetical protein
LLGQPEIPVNLAQARVRVSYNLRRGTFGVTRLHNSIHLSKMITAVTVGGRTFATTDKACINKVAHRDPLRLIIRSAVAGGPTWETQFEIRTHPNEGNTTLDHALRDGYGMAVTCRLVGDAATSGPPRFALAGRAVSDRAGFACRLAPATPGNRLEAYSTTPLQIASGDAAGGLNSGFYDPKDDCAVHLGAARVEIGRAEPHPLGKTYPVRLEFDGKASVDFVEDFYQTVHGFAYFPTIKHGDLPRPVAGWLDWYWTRGKSGEAGLLRQVNWLAENLRDYGLEVIQIDDGWQADFAERLAGDLGKKPTDWLHTNSSFPRGMAWLAEQIHAKGFHAGIWLVPYATNSAALVRERPDWFLKDSSGAMQLAQGKWAQQFGYVLDLSNPQVRRRYLAPLFKTLSSRWGYDYFKLDATGWTLLGIKDQTFPNRAFVEQKLGKKRLTGTEIVREGLKEVRDVIGKKFVLACHAPCPEAVGLVDGARVSGDMSPGWERGPLYFLRQTMDCFYTHNICWVNDPDCLVMKPLTVEQARVFATMFGLTGQHLMVSDAMDELGEEKIEILRRVLPVCATRPLDLYARKDGATVWDLKIERPFGSWDVVGMFNLEKQAARRVARFSDLGLDTTGTYVVYDFWNRRCLGRCGREVALDLPPMACGALAIHRETGLPQVISTSRHITQGGVDLADVKWDAKRGELAGRSRVVRNDPYELRLWIPGGLKPVAVEATAEKASFEVSEGGRLVLVRLGGQTTGEVRWVVRFAR